MWRRLVQLALVLCLALALAACSGSDDDETDVSDTATTTTGDTADPSDSSDTTTAADTAVSFDTMEADGSADATPDEPEFVLGVNTVFETTPSSFTPLTDGDEVPITFGSQGAWMVVLAFKERDSVTNPFDIEAVVTIDGGEPDTLYYEGQETFPGGDGYTYYYNFFLALGRVDPPPKGTPATITCTITDADGDVIEVTRTVITGDAT